MKGRINESGYLEMERGSKMKPQYCPFGKASVFCGDKCTLFSEPKTMREPSGTTENTITQIFVCGGIGLTFDEFEDLRK